MRISLLFLFLLTGLFSCKNKDVTSSDKKSNTTLVASDSINNSHNDELPNGLSVKYLGVYEGIQEGYNLRNENGEEMEVRGEKIPVPSCSYKFTLKLNNEVTLQQVNLSNQQNIFYAGTYQIVNEDADEILISCSVSDGNGSSPNYNLSINKKEKTASCYSNTEPEFLLTFGGSKKNNVNSIEAEESKKDSGSVGNPNTITEDSSGL